MLSDPLKNLKMLALRESDIVADLGAGTGHYAILAGKIVTKGKVYAVEIVKDYLITIKQKAKEAHLSNVEIIWGDVEKKGGTRVGDGVVDAVLIVNLFSQLEERDQCITEVKRILKPKGRVLLIDWNDGFSLGGKKALPKNTVLDMFREKGFTIEREIDAGAHQYGMIITRL